MTKSKTIVIQQLRSAAKAISDANKSIAEGNAKDSKKAITKAYQFIQEADWFAGLWADSVADD